MPQPTSRNRLSDEQSPYLRQHADNPVHWQPWDEQAREAARDADVPIFLSIGYSACHWCHVMEEESFEDPAIAAILNDHFVPIKVDREERPDVDSVYMSICQRVTGRGGWPLSAFLTPDGDPFYVGTYFPPEPTRGQPGFKQLLEDIVDSWTDPAERGDLEDRAEQWTRAIEEDLETVPQEPVDPEPGILTSAAQAAVRGADREHGGWGGGPKFPHPGRIQLLLAAFDRTGRDPFLAVAEEALSAMADGGMYDHLAGGFHRYATDREWTVPHFEKMLYDNAELARAFLAGYQVTGTERYRRVVEETLAFVAEELRHPEGGFYSTFDARSETPGGESEEGAYYVWTPATVESALRDHLSGEIDADLATDLFCERFGVTSTGNFEGETVLTRSASVPALAESRDVSPERVRTVLAAATEAARTARSRRPRPRRDEKVLAGWNGLMISAFAEAGLVLESDFLATAEDALSFVWDRLWDEQAGRLHRRYKDGDVAIPGYLADYAFLGRGALATYQASADVAHLEVAMALGRAIESEFWDADARTLYYTPASGERLVTRPQELDDQSTPSSTGVATDLLRQLDHFRSDSRFRDVAEAVVRTHGSTIESDPLRHVSLALAADRLATGSLELTLAADETPPAWRAALADHYLPDGLLAWRPATADGLGEWLAALDLPAAPPIWADRDAVDGRPTVYACRSFTCSPPRHDVEEALEWADDQLDRETSAES